MPNLKCPILVLSLLMPSFVLADVDKVYHPYVETDTYEIESRIISMLDNDFAADFSVYRFGIGKDIYEGVFLELYLIGEKESENNFKTEAFELELLYQFTEQGEYWTDLAFLFEIEQETESNEWEGNIGFVFEKEFGRWSAALNLHNFYEFQDNRRHAWNHSQAFQLRYRNSASFEPGIEVYSDKSDLFLGLVARGGLRLSATRINWEVGILQEINQAEDESVFRALLEYEF